ncbi:uncharacterized protein LOC100904565 [Galendromus occidentalis]|uniref:Uncharacterized protein LOC100904565 n=1 Tax=Galendromus occidentalis TaxID=34638 RepID=A0AAJ6VY47_9ACAR|nr:uncharacterized protein LOC100904565 [Galendromus occidentalis]
MANRTKPDSLPCFGVAFSMLIYTFFAMAVLKSSSVIYVGSMQMLDLTREQASWPATFAVMLSQLAGPAYGYLLKKTSERFCLVLGALLCSLPMMVAALWATEAVTLCALIGVIQGLGSACSEVIPFVILMRHFQKYRGTVISGMYIITAVSGFAMPVLYEYIRQTYNFRVCLFVMGAANLGMLLGCIIVDRVPAAPESNVASGAPGSGSHFSEISLSTDNYLVGSILLKSHQSHTGSFRDVESLRERRPLVNSRPKPAGAVLDASKKGRLSLGFIHITISRAATVFTLAAYLLVILDYATDRHLDSVQGVLILTVFTIGDLMSRVLSGSLIDLRLFAHSWLMSATFLVQGASYLLLIYVDIYGMMLIASFLVGLTGGCRNILATVMVTEECEESSLALNLGVMNFVTGITIGFQPYLIGYIRDTLGNYEPLFFGFVLVNFGLFATWFIHVFCDFRRRIQDRV